MNSNKEIARTLMEDFGGKGGGVHLIAFPSQRRHLDRCEVKTFAVESSADLPLTAFGGRGRGL